MRLSLRRPHTIRRELFALAALVAATLATSVALADPTAEDSGAALRKPVPESVEDLLAIEKRVKGLVETLSKSTVAVRIGRAQGSGVIVTKDGYVLTAAHVIGSPKRDVRMTLSDGREVRGVTLGLDRGIDAGLIKITDEGEWPAIEMAADDSYKAGDWCIATGHPNGYQKERGSVVRLGRVLSARRGVVQTDCTLVGGDSGGPLFDLDGRVIGVHSRIGVSTAWNFHVPVEAYRRSWDSLTKSEEIGGVPERGSAVLGVNGDDHEKGCRVTRIAPGFPADDAGLREGDIVTKFAGADVKSFQSLSELVRRKKPGDEVSMEILRDGKPLEIKAVLAARE